MYSVCINAQTRLDYLRSMEIFIADIPDEGLIREGELPVSIFDLAEDDPIRPSGPVQFHAEIFLVDDVVTFSGWLRGKFELQCSTCLEYVDYEADFSDWCSDLDLEEGQQSFEIGEVVREDFLLELPSYPRCDEIVEDRTCPKAELIEQYESDPSSEPGEDADRDIWGALDKWQ